MSALSIQPTYPIFTDIDGQPLDSGYVWIGTANLNPITNPINVYWDAALSQPAVQPIRTVSGYPSNAGTPARLYVNSDYSIQVQNKNATVVYSAPTATERYNSAVITQTQPGVFADFVGFAPADQTIFEVKGFLTIGDGGEGTFYYDANRAKTDHNGGTVIDPGKAFPANWSNTADQLIYFNNSAAVGNGVWVRFYNGAIQPKWFGAIDYDVDNSFDNSVIFNHIVRLPTDPQWPTVEVKSGDTFRLKEPILNKNGFKIQGEPQVTDWYEGNRPSRQAKFICDKQFYYQEITQTGSGNKADRISLSNLTIVSIDFITGGTSSYSSYSAYDQRGDEASYTDIYNCVFYNFRNGIDLQSFGWFIRIQQCDFVVTNDCIRLAPLGVGYPGPTTLSGQYNRIIIDNCRFLGAANSVGIHRDGDLVFGYGVIVSRCHWEGPSVFYKITKSAPISRYLKIIFINCTSEGLAYSDYDSAVEYLNNDFASIDPPASGPGSVTFLVRAVNDTSPSPRVENNFFRFSNSALHTEPYSRTERETFLNNYEWKFPITGNEYFALIGNRFTRASNIFVDGVDSESTTARTNTRANTFEGRTISTSGLTNNFRLQFFNDSNDDETEVFLSTRDASEVFGFRMRVYPTAVVPGTNGGQSLGNGTFRWSEVFALNGVINTSDERTKQQIRDLSEAEKRVAIKVKRLLKVFKFNDAVEKKGDKARLHVGVIAQELAKAFEEEGLDANDYGMFCHDSWEAKDAVFDEDGNEVRPALDAGDIYAVRYEQLLAFVIAAI